MGSGRGPGLWEDEMTEAEKALPVYLGESFNSYESWVEIILHPGAEFVRTAGSQALVLTDEQFRTFAGMLAKYLAKCDARRQATTVW